MTDAHRTGLIAIAGRPNVGKSTLLNRLVGQKVSITSRKAQTTRYRISGILNEPATQFIFVDTPGYQLQHRSAMNRAMNHTVTAVLRDVDVTLLVVEALRFGSADQRVVELLPRDKPTLLLVNKIDRVSQRDLLLPFLDRLAGVHPFHDIIPVSAKLGAQLADVLGAIRRLLPQGPPLFGEDDITDRGARFLAAEFIREKVFRLTGEELPYESSVAVEQWQETGALVRIHATIIVDKAGQKAIVIGRGGEKLKQIGTEARLDLEKLLGRQVYLELWVKVRGGWAERPEMLRELGFE